MKHFKKVSLMLAVLCMWVGCVLTVQAANLSLIHISEPTRRS